MWIVRLALKRPYTFIVMSLLIVALGGVPSAHAHRYFPNIDIPVVCVIWSYARNLAGRDGRSRHHPSERSFTTSVNDIEHRNRNRCPGIERDSCLLPAGRKVEAAVAQLAAASQSVLRSLPPG